jgi:hypothetical protein
MAILASRVAPLVMVCRQRAPTRNGSGRTAEAASGGLILTGIFIIY